MDFNKEAMTWDDQKREKRGVIIAEEIGKSIGAERLESGLEFGCGTGLISFQLKERFEHISLVDTSEGMIHVVNEKIKTTKVTNMKTYLGDMAKEEVLSGAFDVIYTSMALHHVPDIEAILKSLSNRLKPGGKLCIVDLVEEDGSFHKSEEGFDGHNGFNLEKLRGMMETEGLKHISHKVFYKDTKKVDEKDVEYSLFLMVGTR